VDVTERALYLRSIPVAAELSPAVLHILAQSLAERELAGGAVVQRGGDPVLALKLITEGGFDLLRGGEKVGALAAPQSFGFLDILARSDASYDVVAAGPTRTLELGADRLLETMEDHFSLLAATLRYAAERMLQEMQELPAEALAFRPEKMPIEIPSRPLDLVERVFVMRCTTVFRKANVNVLARLAEHMPEIRARAGTVLFEPGEPSPFAVFIAGGTVLCEAPDGRRFAQGPGTAVGGVESLAGRPRWFRAVAQTDVVALEGNGDALVDMMEDNFELGMAFISMLAAGLKGILVAKAAAGQAAFAAKRDVSGLGTVPVGA
jgi:CRP-like cAMP-binding protein